MFYSYVRYVIVDSWPQCANVVVDKSPLLLVEAVNAICDWLKGTKWMNRKQLGPRPTSDRTANNSTPVQMSRRRELSLAAETYLLFENR